MRRRRFLAATGATFTAAEAGCLGGQGGDDPTTEPEPGSDETTTEPPTTAPATTSETTDERTAQPAEPAVQTIQFGPLSQPTGWNEEHTTGRVVVIDSIERARAALPHEELDQGRATTVRAFVEDTDFGRSTLVFVQSAGPNACYGELAVEGIGVGAGEIRGTATAVEGNDGGMCADVLTFPGALVRVTSGTPPTEATLTVTDGWGESADITASADDPLGPALSDLAGSVRPDGDPPAVPEPLSCDREGFTRHGNWVDDPQWGEYDHEGDPAFALRVSETDLEYGDTMTVTLTNVSDQPMSTGTRYKYSLQVKTGDGWQDVRGSTEREIFAYHDLAVMHRPGEGFEWTFELTESGLVADHTHDLTVCPDLQTGRYRFVYFSPGVAVSFDLQR